MSASTAANLGSSQDSTISDNMDSKPSKRSFFGFGKKKDKEKDKENTPSSPTKESMPLQSTRIVSDKPPQLPQLTTVPPITTSPPSASETTPKLPPAQKQSPSSPVRSLVSSSPPLAPRPTTASGPSPPRLSTSSSQIFERNVQEHPNNPLLPAPTSTAIPAHIQTENHIPPVLEAASTAITDQDCGVDEVEIVMHSMHQPAAAAVAPSTAVSAAASPVQEPPQLNRQGSPPFPDTNLDDPSGLSADDTSSYAGMSAAAAADKRRLSFISFADVVQAEQAADPMTAPTSANRSPSRGSPVQSAADPMSIATITEALRRSPSPIRGGDLGSSPPKTGIATAGTSASSKDAPGSPSKATSNDNLSVGMERGELKIETMRQTLRKTGSGDLGSARSPPSARPISIHSMGKEELKS